MVKILRTQNNKCWQGYKKKNQNSPALLVGGKNGEATAKKYANFW